MLVFPWSKALQKWACWHGRGENSGFLSGCSRVLVWVGSIDFPCWAGCLRAIGFPFFGCSVLSGLEDVGSVLVFIKWSFLEVLLSVGISFITCSNIMQKIKPHYISATLHPLLSTSSLTWPRTSTTCRTTLAMKVLGIAGRCWPWGSESLLSISPEHCWTFLQNLSGVHIKATAARSSYEHWAGCNCLGRAVVHLKWSRCAWNEFNISLGGGAPISLRL